jgi:formylglycine-generating enzyme required for sulfatase activity
MAGRTSSRLNVSHFAWGLIALGPISLLAQQGQRQELVGAGNCGRCHVSSALEWGLSKHSTLARRDARQPNCVGCHGESRGHVIDEQNTAKPERVAHGEAIAALCLECHRRGCPQTREMKNCESCHHIHALVNPTLDAAAIAKRASDLAARMDTYKGHLAEGERLLQQTQWEPARDAFAAALKDNPASDRAKAALVMIARRLKPGLAGFKIVGDQFDTQSGLPKEIVMDGLGLDLVLIPAGSFDLGSDQHADTKPVHTVNFAPFYLAKCELTQAQWKTLMSANPSFHQGEKFPQADQLPVEQVSWEDCQKLLAAINQKGAAGVFRLPTEAEWEYAARAGGAESFNAANVLSVAWLRENSRSAGAERVATVAPTDANMQAAMQNVEAAKLAAADSYRPHPVGTSAPNRWGLCDMFGNVSEWCSSLAQPYPIGEMDGRETFTAPGARVLRGGNFTDAVESADPTLRHSDRPNRRLRWNGVRLAFSPPDV